MEFFLRVLNRSEIELYPLKITFYFQKSIIWGNCGTFKITLVYPTQKYVDFSRMFLKISSSENNS